MAENSQDEIFLSVKDSMAQDLSEDMRGWGFQMMLTKLRDEIDRRKPRNRRNSRKVRFFSRHYLGLRGERFNQVKQWLEGTLAMTKADIQVVLSTLMQLEKGTFRAPKSPVSSERNLGTKSTPSTPANSGVGSGARRKIVDLIIGTFNNFVGVTAEMRLEPEDVCDGDRMQITSALQNLCPAMGIRVQFSRLDEGNSTPVTPSEIRKLMKG